MSRLFQIYEADLAMLENAPPKLQDALGDAVTRPAVQVALEECKRILSDVRWNYGPPSEVDVVRV